ncbi:hypothetical protein JRO89_XS01G0402000 [Xanthoceras sorbifolium]|uniref:MATH domain-containing protein n=1 Tax=Xanthoceras sorbifolium TaxID=99658 RepID=A0ABQ8IPF3_9ROSI|nr:hypothetical protein JRO89_XS01G0402000 [Xanthoceras sorbifolium]
MDVHYSVEGAILTGRYTPPTHYVFKIESFSKLTKAIEDKYSSDKFDAEGFSWKLSIYPTGDESKNGKGHISIFLELDTSLAVGSDVNVTVNLFVFNHFEDKYFNGRVRRYHALKKTWGIAKFIDIETFSNPEKGYLLDDTCVFGAEIFVIKSSFKSERLSMMNEPSTYFQTWKFTKFSSLSSDTCSGNFGCYNWYIWLYPDGTGKSKGNSISVFLCTSKSKIPADTKLFTKFILRVKDQTDENRNVKIEDNHLYSPYNYSSGRVEFLSLAKLQDPKMGFLVDDTLIIEAEVTLLGLVMKE